MRKLPWYCAVLIQSVCKLIILNAHSILFIDCCALFFDVTKGPAVQNLTLQTSQSRMPWLDIGTFSLPSLTIGLWIHPKVSAAVGIRGTVFLRKGAYGLRLVDGVFQAYLGVASLCDSPLQDGWYSSLYCAHSVRTSFVTSRCVLFCMVRLVQHRGKCKCRHLESCGLGVRRTERRGAKAIS